MCTTLPLLLVNAILFCGGLRADEPWTPIARQLPPPGIELSAEDARELAEQLDRTTERLQRYLAGADGSVRELAVDVEVYLKAVRFALEEGEFFRRQDIDAARRQLAAANERLAALESGHADWTTRRGLVVRGYRSQVDDSVQPYGLVIPEQLDLERPVPLYVWLHGRGDTLADLQFIADREKNRGQIQVDDAIVLHPFGRSCLGWKSTAEIDVLEAIESVSRRYPIDPNRVVLMGFSMGGAGAWHIGAHYTDRFAAVHAGAGFVDVKRYQHLKPENLPPQIVQTMWGVYDVPGYVRNLFNVPVVAYSGELDKQKDAADYMGEMFAAEGRELVHLIGPGMGHKYDPAVLNQVLERLKAAAAAGRNAASDTVSLQTRTLRYNRLHWVEALRLAKHWEDSRIDVHIADDGTLQVTTKNVTALKLSPPRQPARLVIDGEPVTIDSFPAELVRREGRWQAGEMLATTELHKGPGLQGPIDDVLLEPFLVVLPTGKSSPEVERWVNFELDHFRRRWKNVYRGTLREVRDVDVSPADLERFHLICWGDAESNSILRKVATRLPLGWRDGYLVGGSLRLKADRYLPLVIAPNPLNPAKYLVANSGPTHREVHDRTNSLQNPQLGDWAIVDVTQRPDDNTPGKIVAAGVFDEQWQMPGEVSME
jgi:predicted esterase